MVAFWRGIPDTASTKGPTGGADSSNPLVGFAVKKEFTEVRLDLLEAQQELGEYKTQMQDEAMQLHRQSAAQQQSEHEIRQLREQLRQHAELTGAHLEHQRVVNTAEHHALQQASALVKGEFRSAVADEQGRFVNAQAIARNEVQNEVGEAQDALRNQATEMDEQYARARKMPSKPKTASAWGGAKITSASKELQPTGPVVTPEQ